ncbi:MAG: hypothetical protein WC977_01315 [Anaerovoracaceae bacterium]
MANVQNDTGWKTFQVGTGGSTAYCRAKLDTGKAVLAGAGEDSIGIFCETVDADDYASVKLWSAPGTFRVLSAGAISAEAAVYGAAAGEIDDTVAGEKLGTALEAASGSGEAIEILPSTAASLMALQSLISDPTVASAMTQDTLTDSTGGTPATTLAAPTAQTQDTLTDSTGGVAATTLAAPTAQTQDSLTDSTGGTPATTLAAPTAQTQEDLTDSTGGVAATTLAAPTAQTQDSLTDSTGGTPATTLAAPTSQTQEDLTDSTGGAAGTTLAAIGAVPDIVIALAQLGKNGTGALSLTGTAVGDRVLGVVNLTDVADAAAKFETTITVDNQIQQTAADDLSAKQCYFLVGRPRETPLKNGVASLAAQAAKIKTDVGNISDDSKDWIASTAAQLAKVKTDVGKVSDDAKTWIASSAAQFAKIKTDVGKVSDDSKTWTASTAAQLAKVKTDVGKVSDDAKTWIASSAAQLAKIKTDVGKVSDDAKTWIASSAAQLAKIKTDVAAVRTATTNNRTAINALIDALQANGIVSLT